jgi:hypothetical protein
MSIKICSIGEIFKHKYVVPLYQRAYAWGEEEIKTLLEDLLEVEQGEGEYFLGNLILDSKNHVIDGQQRLTTLYMLLSALRNKDHLGKLQFEMRPTSNDFLKEPDSKLPQKGKGSDTLETGYRYISKWIHQHLKDTTTFRKKVLAQVQLACIHLPDHIDFKRYFEVMNARGQQLRPVDVVKARLMHLLPNNEERGRFALLWDACSRMDRSIFTAFDRTQRQHIFGNELFSRWSELSLEHIPIAKQTVSKGVLLDHALQHYYESDAVGVAAAQSDEEDLEYEDSRFGRPIIDFSHFLLHALKIWRSAKNDQEHEQLLDEKKLTQRFEEAFKNEQDKQETVRRFIVHLFKVRWLFDTFVVRRVGEGDEDLSWQIKRFKLKENGEIAHLANTFGQETIDKEQETVNKELVMLQSMLRTTYTSPKTMHWITQLLKTAYDSYEDSYKDTLDNQLGNQLRDTLRNYSRSKVCEALHNGIPQGTSTPHIVFTYLDFLLWKKDKDKKTYENFRFRFRNSVEHFYPQHPDPNMNLEPLDEKALHCLGNLALISTSYNARFSNQSPAEKAKYRNKDQSIKLMLMAEKADDWNEKAICDHHKDMIALLKKDLCEYSSGCNAILCSTDAEDFC